VRSSGKPLPLHHVRTPLYKEGTSGISTANTSPALLLSAAVACCRALAMYGCMSGQFQLVLIHCSSSLTSVALTVILSASVLHNQHTVVHSDDSTK
jgi:hypothetical protein